MKKTKTDHLLAIVKAGLSAVPVYGGPVASLIHDYIPLSTQRVLEKTIALLGSKIERLSERIDVETVDREEFAEMFKSCYLLIIRSHHEARLEGATGLLVNLLLRKDDPAKLTYTELDHFARCLDALSIGAIEVLGRVVDLRQREPRPEPDFPYSVPYRVDFERLHRETPAFDAQLLMGLVGELNALNLVHLKIPTMPPIGIVPYALSVLELTALGERFVEHIMELGKLDR